MWGLLFSATSSKVYILNCFLKGPKLRNMDHVWEIENCEVYIRKRSFLDSLSCLDSVWWEPQKRLRTMVSSAFAIEIFHFPNDINEFVFHPSLFKKRFSNRKILQLVWWPSVNGVHAILWAATSQTCYCDGYKKHSTIKKCKKTEKIYFKFNDLSIRPHVYWEGPRSEEGPLI